MASFSNITPTEIRADCRYYTGYKPCHRHDGCPGCDRFEPRGTEILIIKLGAMGDVLRTKSLLTGLKRAHPASWITWLTHAGSEPLARDPNVNQVLPLTAEGLLALEGRRFDVLLCLDKDAAALALSRRVSARHRFGYAPTDHNTVTVWNEGAAYALQLGLSDDLKYRGNTLSHMEILYRMAELEYQGDEYGLLVTEAARESADRVLRRCGIAAGSPIVGINTGCGPVFETKGWTVDGFSGLIEGLAARTDASLLLLGGPREAALHAELMARSGRLAGSRLFDSGTGNSLEVFFALVERTDAVVTADTLALHAAIALRKHVVAFFGPTCEQEVDLFGRGEKIVTDFACSPCYLKRCDVRPSCMMAMTVETVEAAARRVLAASLAAREAKCRE
ncbi:glycosyltransferase family 9 protein [Candidatus Poribacteria bacterium]|nr:glycosyltransferase family 9 protein [Candidatus Poribacteria bacterium]